MDENVLEIMNKNGLKKMGLKESKMMQVKLWDLL